MNKYNISQGAIGNNFVKRGMPSLRASTSLEAPNYDSGALSFHPVGLSQSEGMFFLFI